MVHDETMRVDYKTELIAFKMIEMFAESIPGCVLQSFAFLQLLKSGSKEGLRRAIFSIICSAATTGFTSASISYDYVSAEASERIARSGAAAQRDERACERTPREMPRTRQMRSLGAP